VSVLTSEWFDHALSERLRVRRSTALIAVIFVGLGLVFVQTRPEPDADPPERVLILPTTSASTDPTTTEDP
jgi:hypothetical protein